MKTPIFTFWEGPRSAMTDLCLETLTRHNPSARVLEPEDIVALGGEQILENTATLPVTYRSDLLRLWLLKTFGGVWVDADCIHVAPMTDFLEQVPLWDLIGVYNPHSKQGFGSNGLVACPFGMREGSPVGEILFQQCCNLLGQHKKGNRIPYAITSTGLLSRFWHERRQDFKVARWEHWRLNPVPWYNARQAYLTGGGLPPFQTPEQALAKDTTDQDGNEVVPLPVFGNMAMEYKSAWNPRAICYHLTNVGFKPFQEKTRDQILHGRTFVSFLFQKSFGLPPAVFPRSWSVCEMVKKSFPKEDQLVGAEIGVFQGDNARQVLQQCPNVKLLLVDKWVGQHAKTYLNTGDSCVSKPKSWANVLKICKIKLAPFTGRVEWLMGLSKDQAKKVEDHSLDFVFIDGDHSFQGCLADLHLWFPKVKPGGFIGGHDLDHDFDKQGKFGIRKALEAFFPALGLTWEIGLDTTWFVRIPFGEPINIKKGDVNNEDEEDQETYEEGSHEGEDTSATPDGSGG